MRVVGARGPSALGRRGVWKRRSLKGWDAEEDHLAVRQRVELHWKEGRKLNLRTYTWENRPPDPLVVQLTLTY